MNRRTLGTVALGAAALIAGAASAATMMSPAQVQAGNKARMMAQHLEKCYGINAIGKNDCAAGAHSCAGQATKARDGQSFVLIPAGDCAKIEGGKTTAS
ncbi:MAG: DUF2282 domain-containing protein [Hyphomicrobiales bacterium]|nr:DUF2282 domain-containing protein [Hyphomicrobiales bacterium]